MSLQRKIDLLFFTAVLIFAGLFYSVHQSADITRESSRQVSQTHQVLYYLENVEADISKIEAVHRGFIITGKENFLAPAENVKKELSYNLQALEDLIGETPNQEEWLRQLNELIAQKIEFSEKGVNLRKKESIHTALDYVSTGIGKALMDSILVISKNMEREEINILNEQTEINQAYVAAQNQRYLLFSGFTLLILFLVFLQVRRNTGTLVRYRQKQDELITELNIQNRQLDDFAHLTSHNIRSPAVNIFTLISFLNENSSLEEYRQIFSKLTRVSKNLNETLNELLDVLQVKKDVNIEREVLRFEDVFTKVKESMEGDIMLTQTEINSNFQAEHIQYPKTYLESIFHNLLSNAIKYRSQERDPQIEVTTYQQNDKIVLEFTDNGLGIDMERYGSQVFGLRKIFHRNENAKGVGLFMTKTQIEALGGNISLKSEPDKGTTFTITFDDKSKVDSYGKKQLYDLSLN